MESDFDEIQVEVMTSFQGKGLFGVTWGWKKASEIWEGGRLSSLDPRGIPYVFLSGAIKIHGVIINARGVYIKLVQAEESEIVESEKQHG